MAYFHVYPPFVLNRRKLNGQRDKEPAYGRAQGNDHHAGDGGPLRREQTAFHRCNSGGNDRRTEDISDCTEIH